MTARSLSPFLASAVVAAVLFVGAPAWACKEHGAATAKVTESGKKDTAEAKQTNVLAPVDQVLSATCKCDGPSECTCKKGECKCKKCGAKHGVKKTLLMEPLNGSQQSPELPQNARYDATGGVFI